MMLRRHHSSYTTSSRVADWRKKEDNEDEENIEQEENEERRKENEGDEREQQQPAKIHPKDNIDDPKFVERPSDRMVRLGETAKFKCKTSGTRPMEVFWFKMNGDELVNDEKYEVYHDDECHYLRVYNATQRDAGMYLCVVSNEIEQNVDSFFLRLRGLFHACFFYWLTI